MDKTVVALFDDISTAEKAVQELVNMGFSRDNISLMAANRDGSDAATTGTAADGAVTGAGIGAVLGGLAGLLIGIGALAIPGIGPIIAAGPLAVALGGAGLGAAAGGVIGALVDAGVPEDQAEYYAEGVRRGGTLVTVRADEGMTDRATNILNRYGPIDMNQRADSWRETGWAGFDSSAGEYHDTGYTSTTSTGYTGTGAGSTGYQETQHTGTGSGMTGTGSGTVGSGAGFSGSGRQSEMTGRDVRDTSAAGSAGSGATETSTAGTGASSSYGTGTGGTVAGGTGSGHFTDATTGMSTSGSYPASHADTGAGFDASFRSFDKDEDYFRQDFQQNFANTGYEYSYYQPGYRFGYELGTNQRFRDRNWSDIEADVRREWETGHPDNAWEDFKDAVQRGWERFKAGVSDLGGGDEDYFRQDYEQNYRRTGHDYEQYRPGYHYGYDLAREDRFRNYQWSDVEREAQRDWETRFPTNAWNDYRATVQYGWSRGRGGMGWSGQDFDDDYFRQDWQSNYAGRGFGYERYQPAYRYGYELANNQQYRGRDWNEIESNVRRDWERQHPTDPWEDFKDAVRYGWQRVREGVRDVFDPDR
jgi:hypothetical protein